MSTSDENPTDAESTIKRKRDKSPGFAEPDKLVTFLIGPGGAPKTFLVHKEIACLYSPVLRAAFTSEFIEGKTQTYRLENTTDSAFRYFVQWIYRQKLTLDTHKLDGVGTDSCDDECYDESVCFALEKALLELWVLAEKLLMPRLQNGVMDILCRMKAQCYDHYRLYRYTYEHTAPGSPLRRMITEYEIWDSDVHSYNPHDHECYPREMLFDMINLLKTTSPKKRRTKEVEWPFLSASEFYVDEEVAGEGRKKQKLAGD